MTVPGQFRVGILGPLEVWVGSAEAPLGSAKLRALLATLALQANQVVSTPRLLSALWDGRPPASAAKNLHTYVHRMRQLLSADAAAGRLRRRPHGYMLQLGGGELDLQRFESLVADARSAVRSDDLERAATDYQNALTLWRGPALADVADNTLIADAARQLDERRLAVLEEHAQTGLELGKAGELLGDIEALVSAHPMRERLREHLMLALYQLGRSSDALAVYQDARRTLATELGMDPGPSLRRLEQAVLRGDPVGPVVSRAVVQVRGPISAPASPGEFIGRQAELSRLARLLDVAPTAAAAPVVVLHGAGGTGKTWLATQAAHALAGNFPGGVAWLSPRARRPDDAGPALIVLDDVGNDAEVTPYLPADPRSAVLITSRRPLSHLDGARHVALDVFSMTEAVSLLESLIDPARVSAEPDAAHAIAEYCDRLPLAVRIVGTRLAARPSWRLAALAARLADPKQRLEELQMDGLSVRSSLTRSVRALASDPRPVARTAERLLGLLGVSTTRCVNLDTSAALLGERPRRVTAALDLLTDWGLLRSPAPGSYRIPDLVALFAAEWTGAEWTGAEKTVASG
jgi:DNA-binding SARP family transcriptional activator